MLAEIELDDVVIDVCDNFDGDIGAEIPLDTHCDVNVPFIIVVMVLFDEADNPDDVKVPFIIVVNCTNVSKNEYEPAGEIQSRNRP